MNNLKKIIYVDKNGYIDTNYMKAYATHIYSDSTKTETLASKLDALHNSIKSKTTIGNTSIGSPTNPIIFQNGIPVPVTGNLGNSIRPIQQDPDNVYALIPMQTSIYSDTIDGQDVDIYETAPAFQNGKFIISTPGTHEHSNLIRGNYRISRTDKSIRFIYTMVLGFYYTLTDLDCAGLYIGNSDSYSEYPVFEIPIGVDTNDYYASGKGNRWDYILWSKHYSRGYVISTSTVSSSIPSTAIGTTLTSTEYGKVCILPGIYLLNISLNMYVFRTGSNTYEPPLIEIGISTEEYMFADSVDMIYAITASYILNYQFQINVGPIIIPANMAAVGKTLYINIRRSPGYTFASGNYFVIQKCIANLSNLSYVHADDAVLNNGVVVNETPPDPNNNWFSV